MWKNKLPVKGLFWKIVTFMFHGFEAAFLQNSKADENTHYTSGCKSLERLQASKHLASLERPLSSLTESTHG